MPRPFQNSLARNRWPFTLAGVAIVLRLAYLVNVARGDPLFNFLPLTPDADFFDKWARLIVGPPADLLGGKEVFFIGPLYAYFLAAVYAVAGRALTFVRVLQIFFDAGTLLFIYGFARRAVGAKAARLAALLWTLYLPAIFFTTFLLPATLGCFLVAASFYFFARGTEGKVYNLALAGAALGLFALDRPNALLFAPLAAVAFFLFRLKNPALKAAAYLLPVVVIVGASAARNYAVVGDAVVVSSQGGIMFYMGNSPQARGVPWDIAGAGKGRPETINRDLAAAAAEKATSRTMKPSEVSRWWLERGLTWIKNNPAAAASLYGRKLRLVANDFEVALNEDFNFARFITPVHRIPFPWFGFLFAFAALGLALGWRRSPPARTLAVVFVVVYAASAALFPVCSRYRMPITPGLAAFAGVGLERFYERWRRGRWRSAGLLTAVVVAVGFFASWPPAGLTRDETFASRFYNYGKYFLDAGRPDEAARYLYKGTVYPRPYYQAYLLLSLAYERQGKTDRSLATLKRAAARFPDEPRVVYEYGAALLKAGDARAAVAPLAAAVRLDASFVKGWTALANAYFGLGDYGNAARANRRLVALEPGAGYPRLRLAEALFRAGDVGGAWAAANEGAALDAGQPSADMVVGGWLYTQGEYAEALTHFRREVTARPASTQALCSFSLTYEKLGDKARAREVYQDYLKAGGAPDAAFEGRVGIK